MICEGGRCEFRCDKETDAKWQGIRIAQDLFTNKAYDRLEFSVSERISETLHQSLREKVARRESAEGSASEVRSSISQETVEPFVRCAQ